MFAFKKPSTSKVPSPRTSAAPGLRAAATAFDPVNSQVAMEGRNQRYQRLRRAARAVDVNVDTADGITGDKTLHPRGC